MEAPLPNPRPLWPPTRFLFLYVFYSVLLLSGCVFLALPFISSTSCSNTSPASILLCPGSSSWFFPLETNLDRLSFPIVRVFLMVTFKNGCSVMLQTSLKSGTFVHVSIFTLPGAAHALSDLIILWKGEHLPFYRRLMILSMCVKIFQICFPISTIWNGLFSISNDIT